MRKLCEEFEYYRGQPIEVITEDHKYCGIDVASDGTSVTLLDKCGRLVRIEYGHIEAVVEPQMALNPLCRRIDCPCEDSYCYRGNDNDKDKDCGDDD